MQVEPVSCFLPIEYGKGNNMHLCSSPCLMILHIVTFTRELSRTTFTFQVTWFRDLLLQAIHLFLFICFYSHWESHETFPCVVQSVRVSLDLTPFFLVKYEVMLLVYTHLQCRLFSISPSRFLVYLNFLFQSFTFEFSIHRIFIYLLK